MLLITGTTYFAFDLAHLPSADVLALIGHKPTVHKDSFTCMRRTNYTDYTNCRPSEFDALVHLHDATNYRSSEFDASEAMFDGRQACDHGTVEQTPARLPWREATINL